MPRRLNNFFSSMQGLQGKVGYLPQLQTLIWTTTFFAGLQAPLSK